MASKLEIFIDVFIGIFILVGLIAPVSIDIVNNAGSIVGSSFYTPSSCVCEGARPQIYLYGTCSQECGNAGARCLVSSHCRPPYPGETTSTTKKTTTTTIPKCKDTDGGDPYKKGTCTDSKGSYTDYCSTGEWLVEYICSYNNDCRESRTQCSCSDGACISPTTTTTSKTTTTLVSKCKDSDGGGNNFVKGTCTDSSGQYTDHCSVDYLHEYICDSVNNQCREWTASCSNGCRDGACISPTTTTTSKTTTTTIPKCKDSDGGDPYKKGTCTDSKGSYTDYCSTGEWLVEYICSYNNDCRESRTQCSCSDGACVKPTPLGGSLCRSAGGICASSCPSGLSLGKMDCYIVCCKS